ncbi:MAG: tetratricopeptide repeat protein [Candidatus Hermodarchaeota archaeon]
MVATFEDFEKSKKFFNSGDITNTLESLDKVLDQLDRSKNEEKADILQFLNKLLKHCQDMHLTEEEAVVLRALAKAHTKFKEHAEALKYSYQALKVRKKLGKKLDIADSMVFLGEDLEVSGNYVECVKQFSEAADIYQELGKLRREKDVRKEIKRLEKFSKEMVEDEYYLNKFHIDKF